MIRRGLLVTAGLLLAASFVAARPGVVKTREGHTYEGEVVDRPGEDFVTVTVRGIQTRINRPDVAGIEYRQGIDQEYRQRMAKLDPKDAAGRLELARWAFKERRYDLARDAADKALAVDPNNAEAVEFLNYIQQQQRLERAKARTATQPSRVQQDQRQGGAATTTAANLPERRFLSPQDVNRIRQEELRRVADARARVQFRNDVERRFLASTEKYTQAQFRLMSPTERAIAILDEGDPALRDDVVIATDPFAIQEYRRFVQPMVLQNCATTGCHGGTSAGEFVLFSQGNVESNDAATYTNFYILQAYAHQVRSDRENESVFSGPALRRMIDRMQPDDSLLIQYGLPRQFTKFPHPDVNGQLRPMFTSREDRRYQALYGWISNTLASVEPKYGIDYEPPVGTSRPASVPSTTRAAATQPARRR